MILVTGASGLVGRALVRCLARHHLPMRLVVRDPLSIERVIPEIGKIFPAPQLVQDDFINLKSKLEMTAGCETVIHAGGLVHQPTAPAELYDILNYRTTVMLSEAARLNGVGTFVFLSTSAVYGNKFKMASEEAVLPLPPGEYARSKYECEAFLARELPHSRTIAVRPPIVYGPGDRGNMLSLMRQIKKRRYFHIGPAGTRKSVIHACDLAESIRLLIEHLPAGFHVINTASSPPHTMREIGDTIASVLGLAGTISEVPESLVNLAVGVLSPFGSRSPLSPERLAKLTCETTLSTEMLESITGFKSAFSLESGLVSELEWAQGEGLL